MCQRKAYPGKACPSAESTGWGQECFPQNRKQTALPRAAHERFLPKEEINCAPPFDPRWTLRSGKLSKHYFRAWRLLIPQGDVCLGMEIVRKREIDDWYNAPEPTGGVGQLLELAATVIVIAVLVLIAFTLGPKIRIAQSAAEMNRVSPVSWKSRLYLVVAISQIRQLHGSRHSA